MMQSDGPNNLLKRFAQHALTKLGLSTDTVKRYLKDISAIERHFGKPAADITQRDLEVFEASGAFSQETIRTRLSAFRRFHAWGVGEGLWDLHDNDLRSAGPPPAEVSEKFWPFSSFLTAELGRSDGTVKLYLGQLRRLERMLNKPVEDFDVVDLRRVKMNPAFSDEYKRSLIVAFRQWRSWGVLEGHWEEAPVDRVQPPSVNDSIPSRPLERSRVLTIFDSCRATALEQRLVFLGLYAGLRVGESAALDPSIYEDGWLVFRGNKNGRVREIPVHPELERALPVIFSKPPTHVETLKKVKARIVARTGFDFITHQLRKTFASELYDVDVSDRIVKDLLGHKPDVTGRYIFVSRRRKREAIARLDYSKGA